MNASHLRFNIPFGRLLSISKLCGLCFSYKHCTSTKQKVDTCSGGLLCRVQIIVGGISTCCLETGDIDRVLYCKSELEWGVSQYVVARRGKNLHQKGVWIVSCFFGAWDVWLFCSGICQCKRFVGNANFYPAFGPLVLWWRLVALVFLSAASYKSIIVVLVLECAHQDDHR